MKRLLLLALAPIAAVAAFNVAARLAPYVRRNPTISVAWPVDTAPHVRTAVRQAVADAGCDLEERWAS